MKSIGAHSAWTRVSLYSIDRSNRNDLLLLNLFDWKLMQLRCACVIFVDLHSPVGLHVKNASGSALSPLPPSPLTVCLSWLVVRYMKSSAPFKLSFGGSGSVELEHWGIAKMAAAGKGMKTVTLGYQSFHSPCHAELYCAYTLQLTHFGSSVSILYPAHPLKCQSDLMSIMIYIIDGRRLPFSTRKWYLRINILNM